MGPGCDLTLMTVLSSPTHPKGPTCLVHLFGVKLLFPLGGFYPAKIIFLILLLNRNQSLIWVLRQKVLKGKRSTCREPPQWSILMKSTSDVTKLSKVAILFHYQSLKVIHIWCFGNYQSYEKNDRFSTRYSSQLAAFFKIKTTFLYFLK